MQADARIMVWSSPVSAVAPGCLSILEVDRDDHQQVDDLVRAAWREDGDRSALRRAGHELRVRHGNPLAIRKFQRERLERPLQMRIAKFVNCHAMILHLGASAVKFPRSR